MRLLRRPAGGVLAQVSAAGALEVSGLVIARVAAAGGGARIAEVATRRALHDGLRPREAHLGIEAVDERRVAIARQHRAELGDAEGAVELGVATAGDVELQ